MLNIVEIRETFTDGRRAETRAKFAADDVRVQINSNEITVFITENVVELPNE